MCLGRNSKEFAKKKKKDIGYKDKLRTTEVPLLYYISRLFSLVLTFFLRGRS